MDATAKFKEYSLAILDREMLSKLRHDWASLTDDKDQIVQIQTAIDSIIATNAYGNATMRPHLNTYMAVVDKQKNEIDGLVEIISSEVGKERICKIMDFIYSPEIETADDSVYMMSRLTMLIASLAYVVSAVHDKGAGHCKIYARDDAGKNIIENVRKMLQNREEEIGLKVETNGRQWLKFEFLS